MKKPCRGERTGLKIELKLFSFLLIVLFFITESYPQIPINGFCKFSEFKIDTNYTSLLPLNFNKDSQTDFILFNQQLKKVTSFPGGKNGNFEKYYPFEVPFEPTKITPIQSNGTSITGYFFTSRKNRLAGIYEFTNKGKPLLRNTIKFDSFPENVSGGDIDGLGNFKFLISGSAFKGLSLLTVDKNKIINQKIVDNESFKNALLVDVTNDGYLDIVAYNLLGRELEFYYNNTIDEFKETRKIKLNDQINSLQNFDINLDSYQDIAFSTAKEIKFIYGDSVSSYERSISIETIFHPDKFILGDFNRDGKIDIAYINLNSQTLSILYAKGENEYYPEIIYMQKEGITNLVPFYSKFINGIAVISSRGYVYTITNLPVINEDVNISLGVEPGAITSFDLNNNGINDLAFIDNFDNSLKLLVRNNAGIPSELYVAKLFGNYSRIVTDNHNALHKTFYCYSPDQKVIEVLSIDFKDGKISRNSLYAPGLIQQVKIFSTDEGGTKISAVYIKNGTLGLSQFEYKDFRYVTIDYPVIAKNVFSVSESLNLTSEIFYWKREDSLQVLYKVSLLNSFKNPVKYFQFAMKDTTLINSFTGDLFNRDEAVSIGFFETPHNNFALLSSEKQASIIVSKDLINHFRIKNKNQLFFGEMKSGGLKKLFIYVPDEGALHAIDFVKRGKEIVIWKVINSSNVRSYFIKNMNYKDYHLVYTDSKSNYIKIKQITK